LCAEEAGDPEAAGETRTPRGPLTRRLPDPFWRQRHRRQSHRENAESPGYLSIWCATCDGADLDGLC